MKDSHSSHPTLAVAVATGDAPLFTAVIVLMHHAGEDEVNAVGANGAHLVAGVSPHFTSTVGAVAGRLGWG